MSNEIQTVTEENKVSEKLLADYFKTLTNNLTETQRMQFCAVAQSFNLNPFKREIYATTYKDKDGKTQMSVVVGYEVYLKRAEMNPAFDGYDVDFGRENNDIFCTCVVYRKDRNHPTKAKVFLADYSTGKSLWNTKPRVMLEKVAICTAFRRAFPTDFGGMPYEPSELPQTSDRELPSPCEPPKRQEVQKTEPPKKTEAIDAEIAEVIDEVDEKRQNFLKAMEGLFATNSEIYEKVMGENGYESAEDVPADKMRPIFNLISLAIRNA